MTSAALTIEGRRAGSCRSCREAFVLRMEAALDGRSARAEAVDSAESDGEALASSLAARHAAPLDVELGRTYLSADEILGSTTARSCARPDGDGPIEMRSTASPFAKGRLLLEDGQWAVRIEELIEQNNSRQPMDRSRAWPECS